VPPSKNKASLYPRTTFAQWCIFNMLIIKENSCFWDFTSHLDKQAIPPIDQRESILCPTDYGGWLRISKDCHSAWVLPPAAVRLTWQLPEVAAQYQRLAFLLRVTHFLESGLSLEVCSPGCAFLHLSFIQMQFHDRYPLYALLIRNLKIMLLFDTKLYI
jgi:hypothetical protein